MEGKDWLVVVAALLGPILAVQAQKAVETIREHRNRKTSVFNRLMATRALRVSPDHVEALNMIDLAFYGRRVLGTLRRARSEQAVIDAWREYLDHLNTRLEGEEVIRLWQAKGDELFVNLLHTIALDVGFKFDRVQLKKGAYSPVAQLDLQFELSMIRKLVLRVLTGEAALKMNVASLPVNEAVSKAQDELRTKLRAVLDGDAALTVRVGTDPEARLIGGEG